MDFVGIKVQKGAEMNKKDLAQLLRTPLVPQRVESKVTINEHRAPTDESVRLLRELEDAARDRVIASFPLEGNEIKGRVFVERDAWAAEISALALIDVNGKRLRVEHRCPRDLLTSEDQTQLLRDLRDKVAEKIANEMLVNAFSGVTMPDVSKIG